MGRQSLLPFHKQNMVDAYHGDDAASGRKERPTLTLGTTGMNFKDIMLSEMSPHKKLNTV